MWRAGLKLLEIARSLRRVCIAATAAIAGDLAAITFVRLVHPSSFTLPEDSGRWIRLTTLHSFFVFCILCLWIGTRGRRRPVKQESIEIIGSVVFGALTALLVGIPFGFFLIINGQAFVTAGAAFVVYLGLESLWDVT